MKSKLLPLLLLSASLSLATAKAQTVLFNENFDGNTYRDNTLLNDDTYSAVGAGKLEHGLWDVRYLNVSASTDRALSGTRSMKLDLPADASKDYAQVLGYFGIDGSEAVPTQEAIKVRFAFNLTNVNTTVEFYIRDRAGNNVGLVAIGGSQANVRLRSDGYSSTTGNLNSNEWYTLEISLPSNPQSSSEYSLSLFDATGQNQIGSVLSGGFYAPNTSGVDTGYFYMGVAFFPGDDASSSVYFDDMSVVTIPEGKTALNLAFGGAVCFALLRGKGLLQRAK